MLRIHKEGCSTHSKEQRTITIPRPDKVREENGFHYLEAENSVENVTFGDAKTNIKKSVQLMSYARK